MPDSFTNALVEERYHENDLSIDRVDAIDLWRVDLSNSRLDTLRGILVDDEIQRADKFVFDKDRNTFARSRCALRLILARFLRCEPGEIVFDFNEHGRPEVSLPASSSVNFNLSHSGDKALIALSRSRTVGLDLNNLNQEREWQPIARRSFSMAEQKALFLLPEAEREKMFYRIWGQKEAYTKALGDGFSYGFQNFTVVVDASGATGLLSDNKQPKTVDNWAIVSIEIGKQWLAALAYDGSSIRSPTPEVRQWEFCFD